MSVSRHDEAGFTLVELLVVILIVGLLAAVAVPSFIGQRDKAQDAAAKTAVRNGLTMVEDCIADNERGDVSQLCSWTALDGVLGDAEVSTVTPSRYSISVASKTGTAFTIRKVADGEFVHACTGASPGCRNGAW